ncbi:prepilin-type N-terminal cleavage/methylation domain-containing protein [uncultured Clostridium sp.]|uniref:prepilin-type N-terminal cleavage/methylation domain-containing protein n=1 Tax=uncultured Clostridium sp. TaxID=59620 RepID=UPI0028E56439|nr:prepilin-type N-terminal cleavage/methylation domain-containing protein [uncultured Clostridium sp.]
MNKLSIKSMSNQISKKKKKGFTLVELIIVIAIIAVLAAIAIPKMGTVKGNANIKADIANAKNVHTAVAGALVDEKLTLTNGVTSIDLSGTDGNAKAVKDRLDAYSPSKVKSGTNFTADVDEDGNIVIKVGTKKVYPTQDDDFQVK